MRQCRTSCNMFYFFSSCHAAASKFGCFSSTFVIIDCCNIILYTKWLACEPVAGVVVVVVVVVDKSNQSLNPHALNCFAYTLQTNLFFNLVESLLAHRYLYRTVYLLTIRIKTLSSSVPQILQCATSIVLYFLCSVICTTIP